MLIIGIILVIVCFIALFPIISNISNFDANITQRAITALLSVLFLGIAFITLGICKKKRQELFGFSFSVISICLSPVSPLFCIIFCLLAMKKYKEQKTKFENTPELVKTISSISLALTIFFLIINIIVKNLLL